ncbi:hypothetical protein CL628_00325 [bacterium]|nr:hypothetical protein [bacterium]
MNAKILVTLFVVVSLFLLVSLAQEMNRRVQVQREVRRLEGEVQEMQRTVLELENLNQYFRTDSYQERLAREKLNYRAPGEQVVLIPENAQPTATVSDETPAARSIAPLEEWWRIFFVPETT